MRNLGGPSEGDEMSAVRDVIHEHDGEWWFWDETWATRTGPYISAEEARAALRSYIEHHIEFPSEEMQDATEGPALTSGEAILRAFAISDDVDKRCSCGAVHAPGDLASDH
jgi:hypothetical protein